MFLDVIESVNLLVGFLCFLKNVVFFMIGKKSNLTFKVSKALRNSFCDSRSAGFGQGYSLQPELVSPAFVSVLN